MNKGRTSVRKALSLTFVRSGISFVFNAASVTLISRMLTPAEIGVFSVAAALVALAQMLRAFGIGEFIIQEKNLTPDLVRTAFTMNLVIACGLAAILFGTSNFIGDFYGDPGAAQVTKVLSLVFILMPFGAIPMAYMRRDMQFDVVVRIQLIESTVRSASSVALAWFGFSYMSMAWAAVIAMAASVAGCALWAGPYRVGGFGLTQWKRVLHFGSNRTISDIVKEVGRRSPDIVIGRMLGMAAAGFYSRGYGVVNMFQSSVIQIISSVAFPAYARDHREANAGPLLFRKSLVYVTGISWPFFAFATLMAFPVIRIAFGSQWGESVPLMRWLCGAAILGTLTYQCDNLLTAVGRYRDVTRIETQYQLFRIALAVLASFYGLEAIAASQVVVYALAVVLYYRKLVQYDALRPKVLAGALLPSLELTIATSIAPAAVLLFWPGSSAEHFLPAFLVAAAGTSITWLAGVFLFGHPLSDEIRRVLSVLRERVRTRLRWS